MALTKAVCILLQSFKNYFCVEFCLIVRFFFLQLYCFHQNDAHLLFLSCTILGKEGKTHQINCISEVCL